MNKPSDKPIPPPTSPLSAEDVAWTEFRHGENFHIRYRHLSESMGQQPYKIGVAIEELMPGKQNCPAHYHLREEEHLLILDGELTVRIGAKHHIMKAGDYVRFPAGSPHEHCLFNHGAQPCRYLIIGDNDPHDVCVYPDSNKVSVKGLGERYRRLPLDYWDGEGELTGREDIPAKKR